MEDKTWREGIVKWRTSSEARLVGVLAMQQLVRRSSCGTVSNDQKGALPCYTKLAHRFGKGRGLPTRLCTFVWYYALPTVTHITYMVLSAERWGVVLGTVQSVV
jgi:hypothetical protein